MLNLIKRYIKFKGNYYSREKIKKYLLNQCPNKKIEEFVSQLEELLYLYESSVSKYYPSKNDNYSDIKKLQNKLYSTYFKEHFEKYSKEIDEIYKGLSPKCKKLFAKYLSKLKETI